MITVDKLTKRFANLTAVSSVSFALEPGELVGFVGPNGAGKSTLLKMLSTFLYPTSGRITYVPKTTSSRVRIRFGV